MWVMTSPHVGGYGFELLMRDWGAKTPFIWTGFV